MTPREPIPVGENVRSMARDGYALPRDRALRIGVIVAGVLAILFLVSQLAIPPIVEDEVSDRLTEHGGSAEVSVSAFPAVRLLASDGKRIEVRARRLEIELERPNPKAFEELDGFGEVDIRVDDSRAGPFAIERFTIVRGGDDGDYDLDMSGSARGQDLAAYAGERLGGPLGRFFGDAAGRVIPGGEEQIPIEVDLKLSSSGGRPEVESSAGTIAGIPLGPVAEIVAQAIVEQL